MTDLDERSLWLQQALSAETQGAGVNRLSDDIDVDVAIVGGGFTGLWTAVRLKEAEPSLTVAILERDVCGGGASGRNGGFVMNWWSKFLTLEKICGKEEALWLAGESQRTVGEIGAFCRTFAPRAEFRQDGWLWTATSQAQVGSWEATLSRLEGDGCNPFERLQSDEVARRSGSSRHLAAVFDPHTATVHPAFLARALMRRAVELGVQVYEGTPMKSFNGGKAPFVQTPGGRVRARKIVLAMNAWSVSVPQIRKSILVMSSDIVATQPSAETLAGLGLTTGLAISDSRAMVHYYRTTTDQRLVFGKGGGSGALAFGGKVGSVFEGRSDYAGTVRKNMEWVYPGTRTLKCDHDWTGPIDKSKDGLPIVGQLEGAPNVFFAVGFSGNGVGPTALVARILGSLVLERDDAWTRCGLVRPLRRAFPPEPIRYVGGQIVRKAVERMDQARDAGREAGVITQWLAGFAPVALTPREAVIAHC